MTLRIPCLLAVAVLAAGCLGAAAGDEPPYAVSGTLTREVTAEEKRAFAAWLSETHGAELIVMESYPERFQARGLTAAACEDVRAHAGGLEYVAEVRECFRTDAGGDPTVTDAHRPE